MKEEWKNIEIDNFYKYLISNLGRIISLEKTVEYSDGRKRHYPKIIMKPRLDTKGYYQICLFGNKIKKEFRIHQLVAKTFIPNPDNKKCVNHKNGIRTDNNILNLEWVTHSENTLDGIKRGTIFNPGKKINMKQVEEIRELYKNSNLTQKQIGKKYNLKQSQIHRIVKNKNWSIKNKYE